MSERHLCYGTAHTSSRILFGIGIIIVVYLPILTLQGVEGKMFRPLPLTVVFALAGSLRSGQNASGADWIRRWADL